MNVFYSESEFKAIFNLYQNYRSMIVMKNREPLLDYPPEGMEDVWRLHRLKVVGKNISLRNESILLDIGCNDCAVASFLENVNVRYVGFDISKKALKKGGKRQRVLCDACHLPVKDNTADMVICTEVIEHINNPKRLISEIARISKVNSKLLISTPNSESLFSKIQKLLPIRRFHDWHYIKSHFQVYDPTKLSNLLECHGFKINRKIKSIAFPPFKITKNKMAFRIFALFSRLIPTDLQELLIWIATKAR